MMLASLKARLILGAVLVAAIFAAGWQINGWRLNAKISEMEADAAKLAKAKIAAEDKLENAVRARDAAIVASIVAGLDAEAQETEVIEKEVIRYVSSPDSGNCRHDPEWVRLHDRSATGADPAGGADEAGEGSGDVGERDSIAVITRNYNTCRQELRRFEGLQQWVREGMPDAD